MGVHTFPKGICQNMNAIPWLEFELNYYYGEVTKNDPNKAYLD